MKKLILSAVLLLFAAACAWGQGSAVAFPGVTNPQGQPIPGVQLHFCSLPAVVTSGVCSPGVTVYKDSGLTIPWGSAILTDGLGNFPVIWFTPGNYCYSLSGFPANTNTCYPFTAPINFSSIYPSLTVTGNIFGSISTVLCLNGDTGLERNAPAWWNMGNCTPGNQTGTLSLDTIFNNQQFTAAGTAAAPSHAFKTDSSTGPYLAAPGTYGIAASGAQVATFSTPGVSLYGLDNWLFVDGSKYTTFANALAALPTNGGEVRIPPDYSETYTSTINVGSATHPNQAMLGGNSALTCNVTGGTGDCIDIHNASVLSGQTTGSTAARTGGSVINLAATANVINVVGAPEGANLGGQAFFGLHNLQIDNANAGTVSGAFVNLSGVLGLSSVKNVNVSQCNGVAFKVSSTVNAVEGPLTLDNDWADCGGNAGGQPLLITANTKSAGTNLVLGGAYVHPGTGLASITIDGANLANILSHNVLLNTYTEDTKNNQIGIKIVDATATSVIGGASNLTGTGETGIDISQVTSGNVKSVVVLNHHCLGATITCINNHITGTSLGSSSAYIPLYIFGGSGGSQGALPVTIEDAEVDYNNLAGKIIFRFVKDATLNIRNWADATETVSVDSGATVAQISRIALRDQGVDKYYLQKDGSNNFSIRDTANSITKFQLAPNGITNLDAGNGANEIRFNADTNAGTSGIAVYTGGASPTLAAQVNGTGNLSTYASVATADYGVPAIQGTPQHLTGQVGNLGATNLYAAAPPAGVYRVCFDAFTTTSGTGTTMTVSIGWTDAGGAKTFTSATWALNSLTITGYVDGCKIINSSGAANITVSTTGTIGTSAFAIDAMAERMK